MRSEWLYHALVIGVPEQIFWGQDPKTLEVYFKAYEKRRQIDIQDQWRQGLYFANAIASTIYFGKGTPPKYPDMPFQEENESSITEEELQKERAKFYSALLMRAKGRQ